MRVIVIVNRVEEIGPRQTTTMLITSCVQLGMTVVVASVDSFSIAGASGDNQLSVTGRLLPDPSTAGTDWKVTDTLGCCQNSNSSRRQTFELQSDDTLLIRTNPGRDQSRAPLHDSFLDFCLVASDSGVRVINAPQRLKFMASKAVLSLIAPRFRPPMVVSHDPSMLASFIRDSNVTCVAKPLVGSRGQDVIRIDPGEAAIEVTLSKTFGDRGIIVQHFVKGEQPGDQRVIVVNGRVLESDKHIAGIHRVPARGEFRANLHAGATAEPLLLDTHQRECLEHVGQLLTQFGIQLAGVDLIGDQVIELNVFSTGGLFDASRFAEIDFADLAVKKLLQ